MLARARINTPAHGLLGVERAGSEESAVKRVSAAGFESAGPRQLPCQWSRGLLKRAKTVGSGKSSQVSFLLRKPAKCLLYMSVNESPSTLSEEESGLIEKQKTDAWLKYGDRAVLQRPIIKQPKWVRSGSREPSPQPVPDRNYVRGLEEFRRRVKTKAVAAIQQASGMSEIKEILDKLDSTGLRVHVLAELIKLRDAEHSKQVGCPRSCNHCHGTPVLACHLQGFATSFSGCSSIMLEKTRLLI
jgi:putative ubiquitin-RnfH superfamily antitoxin RatB of RatAB toxin-antitoxin module